MNFSPQSPFLLAGLLAAAFIITLPFGAWRVRCRRYSVRWWLAIHLVIPLVVLLRILGGFSWVYIPLFVSSVLLGHFVGGRLPIQRARN